MIVGNTYHNKHNGRTIEVEQHIVTDTGVSLYYGVDVNNGHGDYYTLRNLEDHWIGNAVAEKSTYHRKLIEKLERTASEIEEEQMAINSNFYRWVCENHPSVAAEFHEVMRDA